MNKQALHELHRRLDAERAEKDRVTAELKARNEAAIARGLAQQAASADAAVARFQQERDAKIAAEEATYLAGKRVNYPSEADFEADKPRLLALYRDGQVAQPGPGLVKL